MSMSRKQARAILGNRAKWELQGMAKALQLHSWNNTAEQWRTLKALKALGFRVSIPIEAK